DKSAEIRHVADTVTIGVRDHEAAENKEEVHEQVTVPDQREFMKMPDGTVMKRCDEDGAKPSPTVKRVKTQLFLQGTQITMESRQKRRLSRKHQETGRIGLLIQLRAAT